MIHSFVDNKSLKWTSSLLHQSSLSLHLQRGDQARLPLTLGITFPSPLSPSHSPEVTTADSRSDGLNYYLFLFSFTTTTRRCRNQRAASPGSSCPATQTAAQARGQAWCSAQPWLRAALLRAAAGPGQRDREGPARFLSDPNYRGGFLTGASWQKAHT